MKCARIHRFGGPEVLELDELTQLVPGPGEFVVAVRAASVNPVDYKIRSGGYPLVKEGDLPITLGRDGAGVVARLGEGVEGVAEGDAVLAHLGGMDRGAYAEEMLVRAGEWAKVPDGLGMDAAGALPLAADTAWQGLFDHGRLQAGQRVLIHGGSGGVGHLAVQFAKLKGAYVIATAGKAHIDFVEQLGVDEVVNYEKQRFEDAAREVDLVFDLIGGETRRRSFAVLKPGGRLVTTIPDGQVEGEAQAAGEGRTGVQYGAEPRGADLAEIAQLVADGRVRVHIDKTFSLDQAADAQRHAETDHPAGKVLLKPQG